MKYIVILQGKITLIGDIVYLDHSGYRLNNCVSIDELLPFSTLSEIATGKIQLDSMRTTKSTSVFFNDASLVVAIECSWK